jgi:diaminohydroxyphosphoribosylaminopyrimidine deaminase/5-amino-6-(5-phosphoribosylamino)uracil reductase
VYVTLEPCAHHGRTPPCADALIEAGVRRCWFAVGDPDPRVAGQGEARLRAAGIVTHRGLLAPQVEGLCEAYFKHRRTGVPLGILKLASTLDGKVATAGGESQWISSPVSRRQVHRLRNECDAVLVGVGTVLADDPQLTTRLRGGRDALRIVVDSHCRTPCSAQVVAQESAAGCLIATTASAPPSRRKALGKAGAEVVELPASAGRVDLRALWQLLGQRGMLSVLLEGGPELAAGALAAGVVDRLLLFVAPLLIGGDQARPVLGGRSVERLADALRLAIVAVRRCGPDLLIEGRPCSRD